ncbi:MAG TPA: diguanylate cyclase [Sulfurimonas sp.]|nr:diguanylate cyclase [Sulfurimonas sp.]
MREVDTSARYGGEEFVILLAQTNCVAATCIAERIRRKSPYRGKKDYIFFWGS